ncbi:ABC transporter permease [Streptomyces sp. NPDC004134]|uniref:ABC transporter permease n=1 Tax=Streptomyces sp. NPDC004134 TaxID=3364691 RepID=UPI00367A60F4
MTATATALAVPPPARTAGARLKWAVADGLTMTGRGFAHWARRPGQAVVSLVFPVMMMLVFTYLLGGGIAVGGGGSYREYLVPGMLALSMSFGLEATMVSLTSDLGKGVVDRFRTMPMAPSAVLVGRALTDMAESAVGLAAMAGAGLAVGWRWHGTWAEALAAFGLLLLLRFAMLWAGIFLGLVAGKPEMVVAVQILVWPVAFLSSAFTSPETMPGWLGAVAEWNPMSATAGAIRELFGNPGWTGDSWAAQHPVLLAVVWPLVLLAVFFPLAVRRYRGLGR